MGPRVPYTALDICSGMIISATLCLAWYRPGSVPRQLAEPSPPCKGRPTASLCVRITALTSILKSDLVFAYLCVYSCACVCVSVNDLTDIVLII